MILRNLRLHARVATAILLLCISAQAATPKSQPTAASAGVTAGAGALLIAGTDTPFAARGFTSIGVLYPIQYADMLCTGMPKGTQSSLAAEVTAMTTHTQQQIDAMKQYWSANSVRYQVSQGALVYEANHNLNAYTKMVADVVHQARSAGMIVIVSMQTEARGCTPNRANGKLQKLPDALTETAWKKLVPALALDKGIILEVFNEPQTGTECGKETWPSWAEGCGTGEEEGMVKVGQYLRKLAPDNVLLFDGDNNAGRFVNFTPPAGIPANSAYTVHPYYYEDGVASWDKRYGSLQSSGHTILVTEWNESATCANAKDPDQTLAKQLIENYLPAHHIGLIVFGWDSPSGGELVNPVTFAPVDTARGCKAFTGGTLIHKTFTAQANSH